MSLLSSARMGKGKKWGGEGKEKREMKDISGGIAFQNGTFAFEVLFRMHMNPLPAARRNKAIKLQIAGWGFFFPLSLFFFKQMILSRFVFSSEEERMREGGKRVRYSHLLRFSLPGGENPSFLLQLIAPWKVTQLLENPGVWMPFSLFGPYFPSSLQRDRLKHESRGFAEGIKSHYF